MSTLQQLTAIIYSKKGSILAVGKNSYTKTHPYQAHCASKVGEPNKVYLHAEIDAIIKCKDISKAHRISVFRLGANGMYLNARPCKICMSAIESTGILIIEHT